MFIAIVVTTLGVPLLAACVPGLWVARYGETHGGDVPLVRLPHHDADLAPVVHLRSVRDDVRARRGTAA
ncbi:hypothetical protein ACIB24_07820 [Spongisporangium articulatum]|uniref:Secreted protein n=1 Tax=Spongisporangium articulatum TaxID=3362603 RepID=A0ABW8ALH8_9ACTN